MSRAKTEPSDRDSHVKDVKAFLAERDDEDVKWLMADKRGRRIMWRLLNEASVYNQTFTGENNQTNFNEGRRSIGNKWLALIHKLCPESYYKMVLEANEDKELENG